MGKAHPFERGTEDMLDLDKDSPTSARLVPTSIGILSTVILTVIFLATACGSSQPSVAQSKSAALAVYGVAWGDHRIPAEMKPGEQTLVSATLTNQSSATWLRSATDGAKIHISYHWLPPDGDAAVLWDGERTGLPRDVAPNDTVVVDNIRVVAPTSPGTYRLQLTLVHEDVAWFEQKGAKTLLIPVRVQ